jgi:hypothetical protein
MPEYYRSYDKFVWPSGDPPEDWEVSWGPSSEERLRTPHLRA